MLHFPLKNYFSSLMCSS